MAKVAEEVMIQLIDPVGIAVTHSYEDKRGLHTHTHEFKWQMLDGVGVAYAYCKQLNKLYIGTG